MKKTIAFDFDGVIHEYKQPWISEDIISDGPVEGIKELIEELRKEYFVVVVSTRARNFGGSYAIRMWLKSHNIVVDKVTCEKVPAYLYIDDRAITFDGDVNSLKEKIKNFVPWNRLTK